MRIFERWYFGLCWNLRLVIDLLSYLEGFWFLPLYPVCNIMPWTKPKHLMKSFIDKKYSRDTQLSLSLFLSLIVTLAFYLHTRLINQNLMILLILFCLMMLLSFVIIQWIEDIYIYISVWVSYIYWQKKTFVHSIRTSFV
jgi:hypothetical protein